jgi:hypothetical protein
MKDYCVFIVSEKLRSIPMSRYRAYKIRKYFKSRSKINVIVREFDRIDNLKIYDTLDLMKLGLIGG